MSRTSHTTDELIKRNSMVEVTTERSHCNCDLTAAFFGASAFLPGMASGGKTAESIGGAFGGGIVGGLAAAGIGYGLCKLTCKETADVTLRMADGRKHKLGVPDHASAEQMNSALVGSMHV